MTITRKVKLLSRSHAPWLHLNLSQCNLPSLEYFSILHWRYVSSEAYRPDYSCIHSIWFVYNHERNSGDDDAYSTFKQWEKTTQFFKCFLPQIFHFVWCFFQKWRRSCVSFPPVTILEHHQLWILASYVSTSWATPDIAGLLLRQSFFVFLPLTLFSKYYLFLITLSVIKSQYFLLRSLKPPRACHYS